MLLVVARVEGEGDDVGDRVDGEAREDDSGASVIHFRMPCWEAETKDPEWFY